MKQKEKLGLFSTESRFRSCCSSEIIHSEVLRIKIQNEELRIHEL